MASKIKLLIMKKILVSSFVVLFTLALNAQKTSEDKRPDNDNQEMMKHRGGMMNKPGGMMMDKLNLTDAQKAQFKTEKENFRKQMEELKKNENITVKEWKSRMQQLQTGHKTKMQSILTADQKSQIEKQKTEMKAKHEEMAKERNEKMKERLKLNAEQSLKMDKLREEMKTKIDAIRDNKTLAPQLKKEQIMELKKQQRENMKTILTEEQLKQLKERNPHKKTVI